MARRGRRGLGANAVHVAVVVVTLIVSSAISYGAMTQRLEEVERRMEQLEAGMRLAREDLSSAREDLAEIRGGLRRDER